MIGFHFDITGEFKMPLRSTTLSLMLSLTLLLGCAQEKETPEANAVPKDSRKAESKKVPVGPNIIFEVDGESRKVWVSAEVCRTMGPLEQFLCRKGTKEHESVLFADIDARDLHKALILARGEPGSPVSFRPEYKAATGSVIRITLVYEKDGKKQTGPAQNWIRDTKSGKALNHDWVFAGSRFVPDPLDKEKPPIYLANEGDVICVSNFESALLDLPVESSKQNAEVQFEAFTENIPPDGTKVAVCLEVVPPKTKSP